MITFECVNWADVRASNEEWLEIFRLEFDMQMKQLSDDGSSSSICATIPKCQCKFAL